jgi:hypothetical protein
LNLNIMLRGQSNSVLFDAFGGLASLQNQVQNLLGFDGKTSTVTLVADFGNASGVNTMNSGTAFLSDWLTPKNGDWHQGWQVNTLEQGLLDDIASQSAAVKASPTAVVWLHNEYDSQQVNLTADEWQSAVQFDAGLVRAALGQTAATTPYFFVNAIPYSSANWDSNQQIKIGMQNLANDASFNAKVAAQFQDANMDAWGSSMGGPHMGVEDTPELAYRLAQTIAENFAQYAVPGSPLALANGQLDSNGPEVIKAEAVAGHANQVLLTVGFDHATALQALDSIAATGADWFINSTVSAGNGGQWATGAELVDGSHLKLTFGSAVPANGLVFYGYGYGKVWSQVDGTGIGHGIYDDHGMPVWTVATGVQVGAPAQVIAGLDSSAASPGGAITGTGAHALVLRMSEDAWQGDAQFTVKVDGVQQGGTFTSHASHAAGKSEAFTFNGAWGTGTHALQVNFVNDAWGGTPATDRNLHVDGVSYDAAVVPNGTVALLSQGPHDFSVPGSAVPQALTLGTGTDTLILKVSQDAYLADAQYTVAVDGHQVGSTLTASALHTTGQDDTLTLHGSWGAGAHDAAVTFLNDAYAGSAATDRNLHVDGILWNGTAVSGGSADLLSTGPHDFAFGVAAAPVAATVAAVAAAPVDWAALAAVAQANFAATGHWFI